MCLYVCTVCVFTNVHLFMLYMFLCSFSFCYTGFRFIFSFNVCVLNWYCRTSAHVLPLVWEHCVPRSPHKQRLSELALLLLHVFFSTFTSYHWFAFVLFGVLETSGLLSQLQKEKHTHKHYYELKLFQKSPLQKVTCNFCLVCWRSQLWKKKGLNTTDFQ